MSFIVGGWGLFDIDTGLVRFGVRDCDLVVGRWKSKDPNGFAGGQGDLYFGRLATIVLVLWAAFERRRGIDILAAFFAGWTAKDLFEQYKSTRSPQNDDSDDRPESQT